jgi:anti-sigma-K factor RskA
VDCNERRDSILLYAAGALDASESGELRDHLASGCPECAGYLAEAEATLALLGQSLPQQTPPPLLKQAILNRAKTEARKSNPEPASMRISSWDRIVLPAAVAAVLAVAITLFAVHQIIPANPAHNAEDTAKITNLENLLVSSQEQVTQLRQSLRGMQFAELKGDPQPSAVGRVFIDSDMKKWYFFTCGMKPAADGKTYELWLISNDQKIPAGTFDVNEHGVAQLLGSVPQLPAGANVTLAVTDEPMTAKHDVPLGSIQMSGQVQ